MAFRDATRWSSASTNERQSFGYLCKGIRLHHVRFCYQVSVVAGTLRNEPEGSTDLARWVEFDEALRLIPIAPFVTAAIEAVAQAH